MTKRTQSKSDTFRTCHPFGCPVYVLDKRLSDGNSAPKWNPRSRVGIFLGWSQDHARNVAWVLNPNTDHISAQYHVIFGNMFTTVAALTDTKSIELWKGLYKTMDPLDEKANFHENTFTTIPTQSSNKPSEEHPLLQKLLEMKETKGENTKDEHSSDPSTETTTVSEGDRNSYDCHTKHYLHQLETKSELKEKVNNQISIIHLIHLQYIWIQQRTNHPAKVQDLGGNHPTKSRTC